MRGKKQQNSLQSDKNVTFACTVESHTRITSTYMEISSVSHIIKNISTIDNDSAYIFTVRYKSHAYKSKQKLLKIHIDPEFDQI